MCCFCYFDALHLKESAGFMQQRDVRTLDREHENEDEKNIRNLDSREKVKDN